MDKIALFSYDKEIKIHNKHGSLLYFKPNRMVDKAIFIPKMEFLTSSPLYHQQLIPCNPTIINGWLRGFNLSLKSFRAYPMEFSSSETDKACMYRSRKKVYFNPDFYNSLNAVAKRVIYFHELGHQHFSTEENADLFGCLLANYLGYSNYMILKSLDVTLNDSPYNKTRLQNVFNTLIKTEK